MPTAAISAVAVSGPTPGTQSAGALIRAARELRNPLVVALKPAFIAALGPRAQIPYPIVRLSHDARDQPAQGARSLRSYHPAFSPEPAQLISSARYAHGSAMTASQCKANMSCWTWLLIATKRIEGRPTASQIASASL
jgi:hypothetical protein